MSSKRTYDYDVLVAGAGPSGLATGVSLARTGVRVLLVDRHQGVSIFPKATGIRSRTMEILRSWGLEERLRALDMKLPVMIAMGPTLTAPAFQELPFGVAPSGAAAEVSPSDLVIAPQDLLEPILLEAFTASGGHAQFGTELESFSMDEAGVDVTLRRRTDGETQQVRARYLVGADGPRSTVREQLGIGFTSLGSEGLHLATLFEADLAPRMAHRLCVLHLVVGPEAEGLFAPTGPGRWIYDIELDATDPAAGARWTPERLTDRIRAAAGIPDLPIRIGRSFEWDFGAAVATSYRSGRAFLVGDAAHRTSPRGATGLNTGIADGHNLGWKLGWVVRGWAGENLLDSYPAEREPVGHRNAAASMTSTIGEAPESGLAMDFGATYSSTAVIGDGSAAPESEHIGLVATPGARAPHAWVETAGRTRSTLDLFDGTLTLLTGRCGDGWRTAAGLLAGDAPLQVLTIGLDVVDRNGQLDRYGLDDTGAVLVRPDGYVAWRSRTASGDPAAALADAVAVALGVATASDGVLPAVA